MALRSRPTMTTSTPRRETPERPVPGSPRPPPAKKSLDGREEAQRTQRTLHPFKGHPTLTDHISPALRASSANHAEYGQRIMRTLASWCYQTSTKTDLRDSLCRNSHKPTYVGSAPNTRFKKGHNTLSLSAGYVHAVLA